MGISIEKINVRDLGPLKSFSAEFGRFNLIYSRNEQGKTFLAEFLIRSLFRKPKDWGYIRKSGKGKITLSGLADGITELTPAKKPKLEDCWEEKDSGLPPSLARLLVVRGGSAGIEEGDAGISKPFIKNILSGKKLLDKIDDDKNISRTTKNAEIEEGRIIIARKGDGERLEELKDKLADLDSLFAEIEDNYPAGKLAALKIDKRSLDDRLEVMKNARRYEAYLVSRKISDLKEELNKLPDQSLDQLFREISEYGSLKSNIEDMESTYNDLREESKDYNWLNEARAVYEATSEIAESPDLRIILAGAAAAIISVVLFILDQKIAGAVSFTVMAAVSGYFIKRLLGSLKDKSRSEELESIRKEFLKRTGSELSDIAVLDSALKEQESILNKSAGIMDELEKHKIKLRDLRSSITQLFLSLCGEEKSESEWNFSLNSLRKDQKDITGMINEYRVTLSGLKVHESDHLSMDPGKKFSQEEYDRLKEGADHIFHEISDQEQHLGSLKDRIGFETGDDRDTDLEKLIDNLHKKRIQTAYELNDTTAGIIAGITVHGVIEKLREEEDEKIHDGLSSTAVLDNLKNLTGRYNNLRLEGNDLIISDDHEEFDIKDLSTGAREQVMLALRLGFGSKIADNEPLFLILDDAFQHCDWKKREILVGRLAEASKEGWQIIYLTMDDHIRGLFVNAREENSELDCRIIDLDKEEKLNA